MREVTKTVTIRVHGNTLPTQNLLVYEFSTWLSDGSVKLSSIEILVVNRKLGKEYCSK